MTSEDANTLTTNEGIRGNPFAEFLREIFKLPKPTPDNGVEVSQDNTNRLFDFQGHNVRVVEKDGEAWFVLADVCEVLEIEQPQHVIRRLHEDDRDSTTVTDRLGRSQAVSIVNESGLYDVILDSRKPQAKEFRRWITSEVIPSIRKHGVYMTDEVRQQAMISPDFLREIAQTLEAEQQARKALKRANF